MNFKTYADLAEDILNWDLPRDYDVVAAVPRSGIIPAAMLALHWNVKLTTVEDLAKGRLFLGGFRDQKKNIKKVLVLDDSLLSGKSIARAQKQLARVRYEIDYAAVYMQPGKEQSVAHYCQYLPTPRIFQWNWTHHYWLQHSCVDIDGVLCEDPIVDDDGDKYLKFLKTAEPKYIPTVQLGSLVTSRLERYRMPTMKWLAKHGIQYKELIMHPAGSKKERMAMNDHARRKARHYQDEKFRLFIESSQRQAMEIHKLTGKPVLCTDTMRMYV